MGGCGVANPSDFSTKVVEALPIPGHWRSNNAEHSGTVRRVIIPCGKSQMYIKCNPENRYLASTI